jgi:hypothetical protein
MIQGKSIEFYGISNIPKFRIWILTALHTVNKNLQNAKLQYEYVTTRK